MTQIPTYKFTIYSYSLKLDTYITIYNYSKPLYCYLSHHISYQYILNYQIIFPNSILLTNHITKQNPQTPAPKMKDSYLLKHNRNRIRFLPRIPIKNPNSLHNIPQTTQQQLLLEINDINDNLNNNNYRYYHGYLFTKVISQRFIKELYLWVKKNAGIVQDGFFGSKYILRSYRNQHTKGRIKGFNDNMNKLSKISQIGVSNVLKGRSSEQISQYMQIIKNNGSRWSIFKNIDGDNSQKISRKSPSRQDKNTQRKIQKNIGRNSVTNSIYQLKCSADGKYNRQKLQKYPSSKGSQQISDGLTYKKYSLNTKSIGKIKQLKQYKDKQLKKLNIITDINQISCPEDIVQEISISDVKNIVDKQCDNLVILWIPPSTYPEFNGMFTYAKTKKLSTCRLKKYIFLKKNINKRLLTSIIQYISQQQNRQIQGIQLSIQKNQYLDIFQLLGCKIKSQEGLDRFRIIYYKDIN